MKKQSKPTILGAIKKVVTTRRFGKVYTLLAVVVLLGSTVFWSVLSAHINQGNADQLVDVYMISDPGTFAGAEFPGAHTFLFKWPLFALVQFFGATPLAFMAATVAVTLLTVAVLAFVLYRIERRPLMFGTLCLLLASALFLVPIQPYPGALLPVNMAMITTRNLEYVLYIGGLILLARSAKINDWRFWLGVGCLALLGASDKLFLVLSVGGAILALLASALPRQAKHVQFAARWLLGGVLSAVLAVALLFVIDGRLTHLIDAASVQPYGSTHDLHEVAKAAFYGALSFATNFGANPAAATITVRNMPGAALQVLLSPAVLAILINIVVAAGGLWLAVRLIIATLRRKHFKPTQPFDGPIKLSIMLLWSSVAAIGAYIFTAHYYPVDARYITISLFAVFIAGATWLRRVKIPSFKLVVVGVVTGIGLLGAVPVVLQADYVDAKALDTINTRNALIAKALQQHPVDALVGDYWRVMPTKLLANNINVVPLSSCTIPQNALTSKKWQVDLKTHSFSYLLTLDDSLTGYGRCTLNQIVAAYGKPNSSTLVSGTLVDPKELLLFYDKGSHQSAPTASPQQNATVLPISVDQLPYLTCSGPSDMNIVAHQDDDLLFMNPDVLHAIESGRCERTIYITAGDAGADSFYWVSRQQGTEAAYNQMLGTDALWIERIVQLGDHQFATVANPKGNSKISLIFLHLPDGSPTGRGFDASQDESIGKLLSGKITVIHTVDHQSSYHSVDLSNTLVNLMRLYQPTEIRTQSTDPGQQYPDHSDHNAVGHFVQIAHSQYEQQQFGNDIHIPLLWYKGYPIHSLPQNIFGVDLDKKAAIFFAYAAYDNGTCHTLTQCDSKAVYGTYLRRQYTSDK